MEKEITLMVRFRLSDITLGEFTSLNKNILKGLSEFDSYFRNYGNWDRNLKKLNVFNDDYSGFDQVLHRQLYDEQVTYVNEVVDDTSFHKNSRSPFGFSQSYTPNCDVESREEISIFVASANDDTSQLKIEFPAPAIAPKFMDNILCENLLKKCVELVNGYNAVIISETLLEQVSKKPYDLRLGWINFFENKGLMEILSQELQKVYFNNGIIFSPKAARLFMPHQEIIDQLIALKELLGRKVLMDKN